MTGTEKLLALGMNQVQFDIGRLSKIAHAGHCKRCLSGLPDSHTQVDPSRLAVAFYCIGSLDLVGLLNKESEHDRNSWREWIWEQQIAGQHGSGFRPSTHMAPHDWQPHTPCSTYDAPNLIMTYTALLSLAILRDDFSRLDRRGIVALLRSCQQADGSFSTVPTAVDSDLRTSYCAFAISTMLDDWSGIDVERAIAFIKSCRTYEGGYGQMPASEANGGPTYCAVAALHLAPLKYAPISRLTDDQRKTTIQWLVRNQDAASGGFRGRTEKPADACYCFWCGASLQILGARQFVDENKMASFISRCQFKFGGIAKAPNETPDPYHTYLALAALAIYPPTSEDTNDSWKIDPLDPLLNATMDTSQWIRKHVPARSA